MTAQHVTAHDNTGANPRAEGQAHQIRHPLPCAQLPLRISHAVSIVIHGCGQPRQLLQNAADGHIVPPRHIGEGIHHAGLVIHKTGQPHTNGTRGGISRQHPAQTLPDGLDNLLRRGKLARLQRLRLVHNTCSLHHGEFNGGAPHVHAD